MKKYKISKDSYFVKEWFECTCSTPEHMFSMRYFTDKEDTELYVSVHLNQTNGFFKRLCIAFKYAFLNEKSKYGEFDEFIFDHQDVGDLKKLIEDYESYHGIYSDSDI